MTADAIHIKIIKQITIKETEQQTFQRMVRPTSIQRAQSLTHRTFQPLSVPQMPIKRPCGGGSNGTMRLCLSNDKKRIITDPKSILNKTHFLESKIVAASFICRV